MPTKRFSRVFFPRARGIVGMEMELRGEPVRLSPTRMPAANLRFNLARYFRDIGGGRAAIVERTGAEHGMHGSKRPAVFPETAVNAAIGQRGMPAQVQKGAAVRGVQLHATLRWRNTGAGGMTHTQPLVQGRVRGATLTLPDA